MSVYNPSESPSNDHIRHLLHQRTAPALTTHCRFPSITEIPDSPSVYSHTQFTPRPFDKNDHLESPYQASRFDGSPRILVSDRERLNHADSSVLDLGDDSRSSFASSSAYDQDRGSYAGEYSQEDEDEDPEHRISMLGIKMRVHSKAPWEMGGDDIAEEDEPDHASVFRPPSRSKRSLKSFRNSRRPSGDSSRSGSAGKKSFETSSSQLSTRGAFQALAQASMSASSLSLTPPTYKDSSLRQKLSLPRLRTRTVSNSTGSSFVSPHTYSNPIGSPRPSVYSIQHSSPVSRTKPPSPTRSEYSRGYLDTLSSMSRSPSPVGHPYANPEHVRSFIRETEELQSYERAESPSESPMVNSSDSHATFTTGPTCTSIDRPCSPPLSTPPAHSSPFITCKDRPRTKGISAPIPLSPSIQSRNMPVDGKRRETRIFPTSLGSGIAGWQEPQPSAFTLISLEEARAQRARIFPAQPENTEPGPLAFPQVGQTHASPPGPNILTRPRGRSTSAGGKSKIESSRSNIFKEKGEPKTPDGGLSQGKSLKQKKSGFLRIFSGKEKDRSLMPSPPPISTFSEVIPPVPRTPRISTHRVPVPSVSPKHEFERDASADSSSSHEGTIDGHLIENSTGSKRAIPALSINTSSSSKRLFGSAPFTSASNELLPPAAPFSSSALNKEHLPQSAPPGTTDFVALRLRPVSVMFSSHFTDHLMGPQGATSMRGSEPPLVPDSGTPTTTTHSEIVSPLSPAFSLSGSHQSGIDKLSSGMSQDEGRSDVVRALQDQISGAKQTWQRHIWELEGQIRDLKAEIEELRHVEGGGEYCGVCGRGQRRAAKQGSKVGVFNRPRAQTGTSSRFGSDIDF